MLQKLEHDGQPVVITRQGRPIAALVTVDLDRIDELVLTAAPKYIESRARAVAAAEAGLAAPLDDEDAEAELEQEDRPYSLPYQTVTGGHREQFDRSPLPSADDSRLIEKLQHVHEHVFGHDAPVPVLQGAVSQIAEAVSFVIETLVREEGATASEVTSRVESLNTRLFELLWAHRLLDAARERLATLPLKAGDVRSARNLADVTVEEAAGQLRSLNTLILSFSHDVGDVSVASYATAAASIVSFEKLAHSHEHEPNATTPALADT